MSFLICSITSDTLHCRRCCSFCGSPRSDDAHPHSDLQSSCCSTWTRSEDWRVKCSRFWFAIIVLATTRHRTTEQNPFNPFSVSVSRNRNYGGTKCSSVQSPASTATTRTALIDRWLGVCQSTDQPGWRDKKPNNVMLLHHPAWGHAMMRSNSLKQRHVDHHNVLEHVSTADFFSKLYAKCKKLCQIKMIHISY